MFLRDRSPVPAHPIKRSLLMEEEEAVVRQDLLLLRLRQDRCRRLRKLYDGWCIGLVRYHQGTTKEKEMIFYLSVQDPFRVAMAAEAL